MPPSARRRSHKTSLSSLEISFQRSTLSATRRLVHRILFGLRFVPAARTLERVGLGTLGMLRVVRAFLVLLIGVRAFPVRHGSVSLGIHRHVRNKRAAAGPRNRGATRGSGGKLFSCG